MPDTTSTTLIFFVNGINGALGWNAVLAAFDFFASAFPDYRTSSYLPLALFAGYILTSMLFHMVSNTLKYSHIIVIGNSIVNLALLLILLDCIFLQ
ncbi:MAG: hypothetical protein KDD45_12675 [Bdellovibrionales bacterium]|nr:hypothetical protein [Bdellovibrionales bacterium]